VGKNKNPDLANPGFQLFCFFILKLYNIFYPGFIYARLFNINNIE
jgi:hypothetical protein